MRTYRLQIAGSTGSPMLEHSFDAPNDTEAEKEGRRISCLVSNANYWRFWLWYVPDNNPHKAVAVDDWSTEIKAVIK